MKLSEAGQYKQTIREEREEPEGEWKGRMEELEEGGGK